MIYMASAVGAGTLATTHEKEKYRVVHEKSDIPTFFRQQLFVLHHLGLVSS